MRVALRDGDVLAGVILAGFGAFVVISAKDWQYFGPGGPGPGFFPLWYGSLIVLLSCVMMFNRLRELAKRSREALPEHLGGIRRSLSVWFAFALTAILFQPLGFLISYSLFAFFLIYLIFGRPLATALVSSVLASALLYLIFAVALQLPLPTGLLGI